MEKGGRKKAKLGWQWSTEVLGRGAGSTGLPTEPRTGLGVRGWWAAWWVPGAGPALVVLACGSILPERVELERL